MNVDTASPITHVSLCAGYGGIDLGLRRVLPALRTIAYAEREGFCCANLVSKAEAGLMDAAPIWTDVKTFPWAEFRDRVDILSGGYPCQPFSAAGKRLGAEDPRHLWPHISAGIAAMRPSVCFFENVEGHISLGLPDVIEDLAGLGYRTTWGIFSASEVGAPHQRKRVFVLAHRNGDRLISDVAGASSIAHGDRTQDGISGAYGELADSQRAGLEGQHHRHASSEQAQDVGADAWASGQCGAWPSRPGELADTNSRRQPSGLNAGSSSEEIGRGQDHIVAPCGVWPSRPGEQQHWWEPPRVVGVSGELRPQGRHDTGSLQAMGISRAEFAGANGEHYRGPAESSLGGNLNGPADWLDDAELFTTCDNRTDELRLLGNGVVPATAERAFRVLVGELIQHANP